jgi:hypothetical protein
VLLIGALEAFFLPPLPFVPAEIIDVECPVV